MALVVLAGAGLLVRSFFLIRDVDPGFRVEGLLTGNVALPAFRIEGYEPPPSALNP